MRIPDFVGESDGSVGNMGAWYLQLASEVMVLLWDWGLNPWSLILTPVSVRNESNCKTPDWSQVMGALVGVGKITAT